MWDVLPLVAFQSSHSKNSKILLFHLLGCNDHIVFMKSTWVIHVLYGICKGFHFKKIFINALPSSLIDSNVSMR